LAKDLPSALILRTMRPNLTVVLIITTDVYVGI